MINLSKLLEASPETIEEDLISIDENEDLETFLKRHKESISKSLTSETSKVNLKEIIAEEYVKLMKDAQSNAPKIAEKLETMRQAMYGAMTRKESVGDTTKISLESRVRIGEVADLLDMPVSELVLYFLNNVKTANEKKNIEYHLGQVVFQA